MNFIKLVIQQPVTVAVGVILIVIAGLISLQRIPIQLTPNVEDTIIAVTTRWEGASPEEIEREIIEEQEEKLQGIANLKTMTSQSQQGQGLVRLEFAVGTDKDVALREVSDKLREVPEYPENADEPVVEASDPENRDYIAWIIFSTTDPDLDVRTLQDFAENRIEPVFERIEGMSEVNVLGGRERETQVHYNPVRLAQHNITPTQLVQALQSTNRNVSAGELADGKSDVRVRTVSQYESPTDVENTVLRYTAEGPVFVRDVAEVFETYKEPTGFVRSRGKQVIAINAQKEVGANVMTVMAGLKEALRELNAPGGVLDVKAQQMGLNGELRLDQVFDQTVYIDDALALVQNNIWLGGGLAVIVLLLFLRSVRSVGIIAMAIPISIIGAVVVMVAMGRTVNVISLAGMAFAVGMVVDNAIVVLENIYRHLELGKSPRQAAYDGAREVWGAVLASTLTTIVVFIPILLVEEEAGQLFRDIALAICAAVGLSLIVSISVIPTSSARLLKPFKQKTPKRDSRALEPKTWRNLPARMVRAVISTVRSPSEAIGSMIYKLSGSIIARLATVIVLTVASLAGTYFLMPPSDYLPTGNRNLAFGLLIPPPGYNLDMRREMAHRVESYIRPYWEAGFLDKDTPAYEQAKRNLPQVPTFNPMTQSPGDPVTPPPIDNYFLVTFQDVLFHGAISEDPTRVADTLALMNHATRDEVLPDVNGFAFQVPLFRLGGRTGSAVKINFASDDLERVSNAASAMYGALVSAFGPFAVQADPGNFNIRRPELRVIPDDRRLADLMMTPSDLALAVQSIGDGAIIGEYRVEGDSIDLKVISASAVDQTSIEAIGDIPIATPSGKVVPIDTVAKIRRVTSPPQINHTGRQRSVTLEFTAPQGLALEAAMGRIEQMINENRATGAIPPDVIVTYTGSASKLATVQRALLGDGTFIGTLNSSLALALIVVYLMMCVLFQSFLKPFIIMFSVPLATLGGFLALFAVFMWSVNDRYMPIQRLDILTMLGFVILIGIVVNNAILIVHQTMNFMRGEGDAGKGVEGPMPARLAIAEAVRTRVRPILMSTMTSVGGMLPLVLMPGAGSELYRGLGSVVVGGMLVSTVFTLVLVPMLLSLVLDFEQFFRAKALGQSEEERRLAAAGGAPSLAGGSMRKSPD